MKLGDIGEEMVATAIALAKEREATIEAVFVVRVPRASRSTGRCRPTWQSAPPPRSHEARALGEENGVEVRRRDPCARARSGTRSSTRRRERGADLVVLGSSPRWRRQSRFFSPTVDHVLRNAPCEVLVVAFPDGVVRGW